MPTKNKIPLTLTAQQRDLILKYIHLITNEEISQLLTISLKKEGKYEIYMTEEQLEDLCGNICAISNSEKDLNCLYFWKKN